MEKNLRCLNTQPLITAWRTINENAKGFVFITDENNILKGIITDGDIRRFMLEGGNINETVRNVVSENFVYATEDTPSEDLLKLVNIRIKVVPIVNDKFELVDYFEYKSDFKIPVAQPELNGNELKYLTDALLSTWISSSGHYLNRFEEEFSEFTGTEYGLAVSNGTVALHLALLALEIGPGDEVIVPDLTFAATINAVLYTGATPVIVDVEMDSWCISTDEIEKAVTNRTKAIIPVHLYGQPADMDRIMEIANRKKLYVIEDAAEAHGAEYNGKKVGSFGHISCFSFFGNKVITTGEGGMCLTNDKNLLEKMKIYKNHGMSVTKKYWHDVVGYNFRMTNLQAAVGVAQLERIETILKEKQKIEDKYKSVLSEFNQIRFQPVLENRRKIIWLVSALIYERRDEFIEYMQREGIDIRPMFYPLSDMPVYSKYTFSSENSKALSAKGINFPTNSAVNDKVYNKVKLLCDKFFSKTG
jgi:perosamine synthetase